MWVLSTLVWWNVGRVKWQEAEATRKDFNIVLIHQDQKFLISELFKVIRDAIPLILHYRTMYWFRISSSSTFITSDVRSTYIPSQIQDWYREDKFWAKDRRCSSRLWIPRTKNTEIRITLTWKYRVLLGTIRKRGRNFKNTVYWVDIKLAQQKGFKFYQTGSNAIIFYTALPAYQKRESICVTSTSSKDFLVKIIGWKNWFQKLLEVVKTPNRPNQGSKTQLPSTVTPVKSEQPSGSLTQEIGKVVLFGCESTKSRTVRSVNAPSFSQSCVPVSVERVEKDKDADENVDADQLSTVRPVSGQSIGLFTRLEGIDIDFRVSGLPHAVVKQAEHFRVRELVKKIENHPHRRAFQADLQQNSVYNPFSDDSKAIIREMSNVELFELCETLPKVQCSECLLIEIKEWSVAPVDISWLKANPAQILTIGDWMLSQSRTTSSRRYTTVLGTAKLKHRKSVEEMYQKNYEGNHDCFQRDPAYRDSQLKIGWTEEKCIAMDELAQEDHSFRLSYEEYLRYQKHWHLTLNKSGKNAPLRLRLDFRTAVTIMNRLHREPGEERPEPIPFQQYQRWHPSSSSSLWWNWG